MIPFDDFYRRFGVRRLEHLTNPVFNTLDKLILPRDSVYVFQPFSELVVGPGLDDVFLKSVLRPIPMEHLLEFESDRGNPRKVSYMANDDIRKYHTKMRKYRLAKSPEMNARDPNVPYVVNTALLNRTVKYVRNIYSEYNRWYNHFYTSVARANQVITSTGRSVFIEIGLPKILPAVSTLRLAEEAYSVNDCDYKIANESFAEAFSDLYGDLADYQQKDDVALESITQTVLNKLDGPEAFVIGELWKWLGNNRPDSVLNLLAGNYRKFNIVIRVAGFWTVINLGILDSWRKTPDGEEIVITGEYSSKDTPSRFAEKFKDGLTYRDLQVRFIKYLIAVYAKGTMVVSPEETSKILAEQANVINGAKAEPAPANKPAADTVIESNDEASKQAMSEAQVEEQMRKLVEITNAVQDAAERGKVISDKPKTPEEAIIAKCDILAEDGSISAADYKRYQTLSTAYKNIEVTHKGKAVKLDEFVKITPEITAIGERKKIKLKSDFLIDESLAESSLRVFDEHYLKEVLPRDMAAAALRLQKAGYCVTDYSTQVDEDIMGSYTNISIKINPVEGTPTTLPIRIPTIDENGMFEANGTKYRMRKQRTDLPIRKIKPDEVSLNSYYGKVFVKRSDSRKANWPNWVCNHIMAEGLTAGSRITDMLPLNVFDNKAPVPRLYSTLATQFRSFTCVGWTWNLEYGSRESIFGKEHIAKYEKNGMVLVARKKTGHYMLVDKDNNLYSVDPLRGDDVITPLESYESMFGLPMEKQPVETATIGIMGKKVPVGVMLGYLEGYSALYRRLNVTPRIVPTGQRLNLAEDEWAIPFADETHIYNRDNKKAVMLLGGFAYYGDSTKNYSCHEFDKPAVYLNVLEQNGMKVNILRKMESMADLFIDHITEELLLEMKEPTEFIPLVIRAVELLDNDQHADLTDAAYTRIRGYERIAGIAYEQMVKAVELHRSRGDRARTGVEINPHAVWMAIASDQTTSIVEEINPIQDIKEIEAVTYNGSGGRSSRTMTAATRSFHTNDMGTISEGGVDSADVGTNIYMSANPMFTSVRGMSKQLPPNEIPSSSLFSTAALLSPGSDSDDPKRVAFAGIQHRHTVPCVGYRPAAVRTGGEQTLGHRTSDLFCTTARQDGKVVSVSEDGIVVQYADGTTKGIELGRRFGKASGMTIPHKVITDMVTGQTFKEGDVIAYNPGYFERDPMYPEQVLWKTSALVDVVLMETPITLEDSSAISKELASLMRSEITKTKDVVVKFTHSLHRQLKAGAQVVEDDILCIIQEVIGADNTLFDEKSIETLISLGAHTPKAGAIGTIERIEVFYHGDKEDMTPTLRKLADESDRELMKRRGAAGKKRYSGSVTDGSFRVNGDPLALDTACIRYYITSEVPAGVGDKGVFVNQMKTVFGEVMAYTLETVDGTRVDAIFGQKSIDDRIVSSPGRIGTTTTLLDFIGKKAADIYFG